MKFPKLNQKGITHILAPLLFIVLFAAVGSFVLLKSHAAVTCACGGSTGGYVNGKIYSGGYMMDPNATTIDSGITNIAPNGFDRAASNISFDGKQVANTGYDASTGVNAVFVGTVTATSGSTSSTITNEKAISHFSYDATPTSPPVWSPDGSKVAFSLQGVGGQYIWAAKTDGTGGSPIPSAPTKFSPSISWRPASINIAYTPVASSASGSKICIISYSGSYRGCDQISLGTVKVGGYLGQGGLAVSPTDGSVAYVAYNNLSAPVAPSADIYTTDVKGGNLKRLTTLAAGKQVVAVVWSPDGTKIAFLLDDVTKSTTNTSGLYVMNAAVANSQKQISSSKYFQPNSLSWPHQ